MNDRIRDATFPHGVRMTVSVGVAERSGDGDLAEDLYHRADESLYAAKAVRATRTEVVRAEPRAKPVNV